MHVLIGPRPTAVAFARRPASALSGIVGIVRHGIWNSSLRHVLESGIALASAPVHAPPSRLPPPPLASFRTAYASPHLDLPMLVRQRVAVDPCDPGFPSLPSPLAHFLNTTSQRWPPLRRPRIHYLCRPWLHFAAGPSRHPSPNSHSRCSSMPTSCMVSINGALALWECLHKLAGRRHRM